jgi:hypothetical protein
MEAVAVGGIDRPCSPAGIEGSQRDLLDPAPQSAPRFSDVEYACLTRPSQHPDRVREETESLFTETPGSLPGVSQPFVSRQRHGLVRALAGVCQLFSFTLRLRCSPTTDMPPSWIRCGNAAPSAITLSIRQRGSIPNARSGSRTCRDPRRNQRHRRRKPRTTSPFPSRPSADKLSGVDRILEPTEKT